MGYIEDLRALIGHKRIILPGSAVIIKNAYGKVLMQQRRHPKGRWGLPGGLMELGESAEETAKREALEETGLIVDGLKLLGVYSGKDYLCTAANGDEWYVVTIAYVAESYAGEPAVSDGESLALAWIDPAILPDDTAKSHRKIINDYIKSGK